LDLTSLYFPAFLTFASSRLIKHHQHCSCFALCTLISEKHTLLVRAIAKKWSLYPLFLLNISKAKYNVVCLCKIELLGMSLIQKIVFKKCLFNIFSHIFSILVILKGRNITNIQRIDKKWVSYHSHNQVIRHLNQLR